MVIEIKSDQLTVQFKTLGGALSSIKDREGIEYLCGKEIPLTGVDKRLYFFQSAAL